MKNLEIERKYLVKKNDLAFDYKKYPCHKISQAFIYLKPAIRIRKSDDRFFLTVKSKPAKSFKGIKDDLVRDEYEIEIDKTAYKYLSKLVYGRAIFKTRYLIPYRCKNKNYTIELDVFEKELKGLLYAEVEFKNIKDAMNFNAPNWFFKDVTGIEKYKNTSLSICKNIKELLKY